MNEQDRSNSRTDDVEGHVKRPEHAEPAEADHDVEGHAKELTADVESAEGDDNVEGHMYVVEPDRANDNRF